MSTVPNSAGSHLNAAGELLPLGTGAFVPPLIDGDRLSRAEFHRRYENMPEVKKAELINGVVYMGSPVSCFSHAGQDSSIHTWAGHYKWKTPGTQSYSNGTVLLNENNEPQPDYFLRIRPECGGQSKNDGQYVSGAPELILEVAASSSRKDLTAKFAEFQKAGVSEYLVWRVLDGTIDWFALQNGSYAPLKQEDGVLKSRVFPGLWLDVPAMLRDDFDGVMAKLEDGLATPEHQTFVAKLGFKR